MRSSELVLDTFLSALPFTTPVENSTSALFFSLSYVLFFTYTFNGNSMQAKIKAMT